MVPPRPHQPLTPAAILLTLLTLFIPSRSPWSIPNSAWSSLPLSSSTPLVFLDPDLLSHSLHLHLYLPCLPTIASTLFIDHRSLIPQYQVKPNRRAPASGSCFFFLSVWAHEGRHGVSRMCSAFVVRLRESGAYITATVSPNAGVGWPGRGR